MHDLYKWMFPTYRSSKIGKIKIDFRLRILTLETRTRKEGTEINGRELNAAQFLSFLNIFYCNRIGKLDGLHAKNGKIKTY